MCYASETPVCPRHRGQQCHGSGSVLCVCGWWNFGTLLTDAAVKSCIGFVFAWFKIIVCLNLNSVHGLVCVCVLMCFYVQNVCGVCMKSTLVVVGTLTLHFEAQMCCLVQWNLTPPTHTHTHPCSPNPTHPELCIKTHVETIQSMPWAGKPSHSLTHTHTHAHNISIAQSVRIHRKPACTHAAHGSHTQART